LKTAGRASSRSGRGRGSRTEWVEYGPNEQPRTEVQRYRQVLSGGKRRIENLDPETDKVREVTVFDGEVVKSVNVDMMLGTIQEMRNDYVPPAAEYETWFRSALGVLSLAAVFRERIDHLTVTTGADGNLTIGAPHDSGASIRQLGFEVTLDPTHAMRLARIDSYRNDPSVRYNEIVVKAFHEVEAGVWAPTEMEYQAFNPDKSEATFGRPVNVIRGVVDVSRSKWNTPIDDDEFVLAFPPGVQVSDTTRNITFVTGEGDTGKNLDRLVQEAHDVVPVQRLRPEPESESKALLWAGLAVAATVVVLGLLAWRLRPTK
jgi:outer membrane lipoprotein-sorting protein